MDAGPIVGAVIMGALIATMGMIPFLKSRPVTKSTPKNPPPNHEFKKGGRKKYTRRV